jgi:hypothetical protein
VYELADNQLYVEYTNKFEYDEEKIHRREFEESIPQGEPQREGKTIILGRTTTFVLIQLNKKFPVRTFHTTRIQDTQSYLADNLLSIVAAGYHQHWNFLPGKQNNR